MRIFKKTKKDEVFELKERLIMLERDKELKYYKDDSKYGIEISFTREHIIDLLNKEDSYKFNYVKQILGELLDHIKHDRESISGLYKRTEDLRNPRNIDIGITAKDFQKNLTPVFQRLARLEKTNAEREKVIETLFTNYKKLLDFFLSKPNDYNKENK